MNKNANQAGYVLFLCVLFAVLGIAGGWTVASRKAGSGGGGEGEGGHGGHDHGGHAHAAAAPAGLSKQTIANLGVTMKDADTSEFKIFKTIPATVVDSPNATQTMTAPVSGVVREVRIRQGVVAAGGTVVITVIRDPFPRPTLKLSDEIIKPANEQIHTAVSDLRRASKGASIFKTELERVSAFTKSTTEPSLLPRKTEIDLKYELARADQELANAHENLTLHGFTEEQIKEVESGKTISLYSHEIWIRALKKGGLWSEQAETIHAALPAAERDAVWTIAIIGELTGMGLLTPELVSWVKGDAKVAALFIDIAGLLQQGHTMQQIKSLYAANAMNALVEIQVPAFEGIQDWDVQQVLVKTFDKVEAGAKLVVLANPRQMFLRAQPAGEEFQILTETFTKAGEFEAVPLVEGSGPVLKALKVLSIGGDENSQTHSSGTFGFIPVQNEVQGSSDFKTPGFANAMKFRSWKLHEGSRYQLRIPVKTLKDVFVFPAEALAEDGPDKVVYLQNGDSFKPAKVVILYQDHDVVVLDSKLSELFSGDTVVMKGAFGLSLALKTGGGAIDPHAGHNH